MLDIFKRIKDDAKKFKWTKNQELAELVHDVYVRLSSPFTRELLLRRLLTEEEKQRELIDQLMNPSGKAGWWTCQICGAKVKSKNLHEHMTKVHPKP